MSPVEQFDCIITCLQGAESAAMWAFWRERFNTDHPDHVRQQEIENPTRYATANFFAAKGLYCTNRTELDKIYEQSYKDTKAGELFQAMRRVVDKEMEEQMEAVLTKE